ncbi:MAG: [LysW]-aminoadipate kinase [Candidatus Burarchaeum sp.]|nr:[LysW]-aminoadipate kinase [Candidatus Burarchaeum sp.]MDO8339136.1 [LysW]-aminoadipate kinase [Candidatus Burarchaeum sp.]
MGTTVIKIGGSIADDVRALAAEIAGGLAGASGRNERFVVVHGGAAKTTEIAEKLGKPQKFVESPGGFRSRFTDKESMEIFVMVTCGLVNKRLVEQMLQAGVNALGMSGADCGIVRAKRKDMLRVVENGKEKILRGDYSGKVEAVNALLLHKLLDAGVVPVIAPVALSNENELVSMDGDRGAASVAGAMKAERLIIFTDVDGFFRNFPNDLVREIRGAKELDAAMEVAKGGMKKKLLAAREALDAGVGEIVIANARVERPLANALNGEKRTVVRK